MPLVVAVIDGPTNSIEPTWVARGAKEFEPRRELNHQGLGNRLVDEWRLAGNTDGSIERGTELLLSRFWDSPAERVDPWTSVTSTCNGNLPIWCVEN